jgi:hypothetical protein
MTAQLFRADGAGLGQRKVYQDWSLVVRRWWLAMRIARL